MTIHHKKKTYLSYRIVSYIVNPCNLTVVKFINLSCLLFYRVGNYIIHVSMFSFLYFVSEI